MRLPPPPAVEGQPRRTALMEPFWEGCRRGRLTVQRCSSCGRATFPATPLCPHCRTDTLVWEPTRPTGRVYTFTTVWRAPGPSFEVPYVVAWVDMDDRWQLMAPIVGCEPEQVAIDARVTARFSPVGSDDSLPVFHLAEQINQEFPDDHKGVPR